MIKLLKTGNGVLFQEALTDLRIPLDDVRDEKGNYLVHIATRLDHSDILRLLLDKGASPDT